MSRKNKVDQPYSRAVAEKMNYAWKWKVIVQRMALGRFKWEGLPDSVDERFLERLLLLKGQAVFFELNDNLMATNVVTYGPRDEYDNINEYTAIGASGFNYQIPKGEGVLMYDTLTRMNTWNVLELYIDELAELDQLARANRRQQRNMTIFSGPAESASDLDKLARDMEMLEMARITTSGFSELTDIKAIQTGIKYLQAEFHADRIATLNQLYLFLGVAHIPFEKQERLVSGEAEIADDSVARIREDLLSARRFAAEKINEKFGTDISVEWKMDEMNTIAEDRSEIIEEEVENV